MKYFITKYAMTEGILEKEGELCSDISIKMIVTKEEGKCPQYFHGNDFHTDKENAIKRAMEMRTKN